MSNAQFFRDAHATVQLNGVLSYKGSNLSNHIFQRMYGSHGLPAVLNHFQRCAIEHGLALLVFHEHVHHTVLEYLEVCQAVIELLALLRVGHGILVQNLHRTDGFRRKGQNAVDGNVLQQRKAAIQLAQHIVGMDEDVLEGDFGRLLTVYRRKRIHGYAFRLGINQEQSNAVFIALAAAGASADDKLVGAAAMLHHAFVPSDDEA